MTLDGVDIIALGSNNDIGKRKVGRPRKYRLEGQSEVVKGPKVCPVWRLETSVILL